MSTKNNPGQWDCYSKAAPDEPMFVLLARDPLAPDIVREWINRRLKVECDLVKTQAAYECARLMEEWRAANPPETKP